MQDTFDFEAAVWDLMRSGIGVELLIPTVREEGDTVGIRLRPWGKQLPKDKMILATGNTFAEALQDAITKAKDRRWERLSWTMRPWKLRAEGTSGPGDAWGLL